MPAGYGTRCESCYWREAFDRRLAQNRALFACDRNERLFAEYAAWVCETHGVRIAALRLDTDASFFAELAKLGPELPMAEGLLEHFAPVRLVRHRLAMRFLAERCYVHLDANAKRAATERRRIQALTSALPPASSSALLLCNYRDHLLRTVEEGKLSLSSARLYLRAALGLLQAAIASGLDRPVTASVKPYVSRHHGQKASLYPFLTFLGLRMPLDGRSAKLAARASRGSVRAALLARLQKKPNGRPDEQAVVLALRWFHNLSLVDARKIARKNSATIDGKWIILRDGDAVAYHLPAQIGEALSQCPGGEL